MIQITLHPSSSHFNLLMAKWFDEPSLLFIPTREINHFKEFKECAYDYVVCGDIICYYHYHTEEFAYENAKQAVELWKRCLYIEKKLIEYRPHLQDLIVRGLGGRGIPMLMGFKIPTNQIEIDNILKRFYKQRIFQLEPSVSPIGLDIQYVGFGKRKDTILAICSYLENEIATLPDTNWRLPDTYNIDSIRKEADKAICLGRNIKDVNDMNNWFDYLDACPSLSNDLLKDFTYDEFS